MNFKQLEALVLEHAYKQGMVLEVADTDVIKDLIGHQIMDIILLCEALGFEFEGCLRAAYHNLYKAN